jgi:hypothetical protein
VLGEQIEAALHAGQHAERQHVDLHEFERVDVVLVPFDDLAVLHRRRLDRHEFVEPVAGQDEAAGCCDRWRGVPIELLRQLERQAQARIAPD